MAATGHNDGTWGTVGAVPGRREEGELLQVATVTRGLSDEEGGCHWSGELRLWDNEILMGWYAANDGSVRSGPKARCTSCCTRTA